MRFTTNEDIEAPIGFVFERFSDFDVFERLVLQQGSEITRVDTLSEPGVGMVWEVRTTLRGRQRRINVELVDFEVPAALHFHATSDGFTAGFTVDLIGLSRKRTRVSIDLNIRPKTLTARLALQSARLAKSSLTKRFKRRVRSYGIEIEDRFRMRSGAV